jgi:Tfp pilus assembly protein PilF
MKKGIEYFQKAIESDPAYALAYTGLADSYMYFSFYGYLSPKDAFQKAKAAARKALEIDDTLAEAHASLGYISMIYDWEWSASEHSIRRAIELNPGYATAHHWYAAYLAIVGHFEESISEIKRALELDPLSLRLHCELGNYLRWSGRVDEALEQLEKTLEMNPDFHLVHMHLGLTYQLKGMYNKSISSFQKSLKLVGDSPLVLGSLGYTYVLSGQRDKAKKLLQKLEEQSKERYVPFLYIANIYAELGEMDKAFEWIDKAHEEHDTLMSFLKTWPEFERIRSDPRGKALLKKIGLEK